MTDHAFRQLKKLYNDRTTSDANWKIGISDIWRTKANKKSGESETSKIKK